MVQDSEFDKKTGGFPPWFSDQYLYPRTDLRQGWASAHFERNQLLPNSIGCSPLAPDYSNDLNLNMDSGLPSPFRRISSYPGLDRPVSGLILVTWALSYPHLSPVRVADASLSLRLLELGLPQR